MTIRVGPAGLGSVKEAISNLERYHKLGITACEIAFTYGVYIHSEKDARGIGEAAKKFNIQLSIHAPYYINLNSDDKKKVEESKKRILDSCKIGEILGASFVVFHPGFYGKKSPEETYEKIKKEINEMQAVIKKEKWKIELAPETTGKVNVFGKEEEILKLVEDTGCFFTIDFAHLLARSQGKMSYAEMVEKVYKFKRLHCHFSGIEWGEKGEKNHKPLDAREIEKLVLALPKNKEISLINESPDTVGDSVKILKAL